MQVAGVDTNPTRQFPVRERFPGFLAQHLEHAQAQRMAERLELIGPIYRQNV
jgi:hypothetical protein